MTKIIFFCVILPPLAALYFFAHRRNARVHDFWWGEQEEAAAAKAAAALGLQYRKGEISGVIRDVPVRVWKVVPPEDAILNEPQQEFSAPLRGDIPRNLRIGREDFLLSKLAPGRDIQLDLPGVDAKLLVEASSEDAVRLWAAQPGVAEGLAALADSPFTVDPDRLHMKLIRPCRNERELKTLIQSLATIARALSGDGYLKAGDVPLDELAPINDQVSVVVPDIKEPRQKKFLIAAIGSVAAAAAAFTVAASMLPIPRLALNRAANEAKEQGLRHCVRRNSFATCEAVIDARHEECFRDSGGMPSPGGRGMKRSKRSFTQAKYDSCLDQQIIARTASE